MLDKIVESSIEVKNKEKSRSLKSQDFENNIIAFCGERGEGKSSAMLTFVNAVNRKEYHGTETHSKRQNTVDGNKLNEIKGNNRFQDDNYKSEVIYVLHFPKIKDKGFCPGASRNQNARIATMKQARSITALLEKETGLNGKIRGIDACSNKLYCRPEVFAQVFRYLTDLEFISGGNIHAGRERNEHRCKLHATYHVGEDFLDIADGLRAIDEAVLFCGLRRGSRIGHALALGIDPYKYYKGLK